MPEVRSVQEARERARAPRKPTRAKQLGVTDDEYARLLAAQDGHCALCPNTPKSRRLHTDHDHVTDAVRGLLCHRCNRNLPTWVTVDWLLGAAAYLAASRSEKMEASYWPDYAKDLAQVQREARKGVPEFVKP